MTAHWMVKTALATTVALWLGSWVLAQFEKVFQPYAERIAAHYYLGEDGVWH